MSRSTAMRAISRMSSAARIEPVGLCGELITISRVRSVTREATSSTSMRKSFSSRSGAATGVPPA